MFRSSDVDLLINYIRSVKDVATRNHGFYLIASLGKACPQLLSDSIVDLFLVIGDAIKQVSVNILGDISLCSLLLIDLHYGVPQELFLVLLLQGT